MREDDGAAPPSPSDKIPPACLPAEVDSEPLGAARESAVRLGKLLFDVGLPKPRAWAVAQEFPHRVEIAVAFVRHQVQAGRQVVNLGSLIESVIRREDLWHQARGWAHLTQTPQDVDARTAGLDRLTREFRERQREAAATAATPEEVGGHLRVWRERRAF